MGHVHLGDLPRTWHWNQVVALLEEDAGVAEIASKTLEAAEDAFRRAAFDKGLLKALFLLTQLPLAARAEDYVGKLAELGIRVDDHPSVPALMAAFTDAIDSELRWSGGRTDVGEMAQMAAVETLAFALTKGPQSLFGTSPGDVRRDLAKLATKAKFGSLARDYFARVTHRFLSFFLSRELSNHVGGERRFQNIAEHAVFNAALKEHCQQAAQYVETFAGDWHSKTNYEQGITQKNTRGLSITAFEKLRTALHRDWVAA
jgi:hypothetical protein